MRGNKFEDGVLKVYYKILSFDLSDDSFTWIELPELVDSIDAEYHILEGGGECLCLLEDLNDMSFT